mmetsp:Transcript_4489/g.7243  ORF Transcript_4489/g.7243 Transcript_4489/m.7243 type:complete len:126 (+) Transcript_4489:46-423(+)
MVIPRDQSALTGFPFDKALRIGDATRHARATATTAANTRHGTAEDPRLQWSGRGTLETDGPTTPHAHQLEAIFRHVAEATATHPGTKRQPAQQPSRRVTNQIEARSRAQAPLAPRGTPSSQNLKP